jgi:hypothetical protein
MTSLTDPHGEAADPNRRRVRLAAAATGTPPGEAALFTAVDVHPLYPMAKSVQRIGKPRITTALPAQADRDRSLER